ncbi:MAG TPA: DUF1592 domain-containing protein [Candidatus Solibacter sp.]|nr:DUF1592 domain-containing protein [Candidatus Solibacter sp.]
MRNVCFFSGIALYAATVAHGQTTGALAVSTAQRTFLDQHCIACHNDKVKSGGMSLARLSPELGEKVIRKVRTGMMPPPGMPRATAADAQTFVTSLESTIDRAAAAHPNPGRPALHRLNRTEYANSVRELLAVQVDVSSLLPADDMSHGFDNMADVLTISPALLDGYVRAASKISREAMGDPAARAITHTYSIPRVISQVRHVEGTPFGTRGGMAVTHDFPADGKYIFKLGFYYAATGALFGMNQGKGQQIEIAIDGKRVALIEINPAWTLAKDGVKTDPIFVSAGPKRVSASFPVKFDGPIEDEYRMVEQSLVDVTVGSVPGMTTLPHLHELSVTGPQKVEGISDTPSRRRILTCKPAQSSEEVACAKKILAPLVRQAYRRPTTQNDLEGLLTFYQAGRNEGDFDNGIRAAIQAILANPEFVLRFERVPDNAASGSNFRIGDLELASRLAFFLWSAPPDSALIAAAEKGTLHEPAVLEQQTRRMLADPRSAALATNFAGQWLHLQNLKTVNPDLFEFPDFDRTLAVSMRRETEMLFENILREDRSVLEMLTANYTFTDERLAKHYGIPNVMGTRFRKVALSDPNRYGLLGHAGILTLTSTALRTSPVQRGKYVMEVLLGTPPPPPPAVVPALPENADLRTAHVAKPLSVRVRLEQHRKDPNCAGCHKLMDPIGFALENFDAVGLWRTKDSGFVIDTTGTMFDGAKLNGPASLRRAVLNHSDAFLGTFTENLLAYGLGRITESYDMPAVRAIAREAESNGNRFSSFVLGIVKSAPFQMRRVEEAVAEPAKPASGGNQ